MASGEPLQLDRMAIEDVGSNPERLAAAIHDQLGLAKGPVPVAAIAAALDIVEIWTAATRGLEGALVTTEERSEGIIMVRAGATPQRRRFTVGHELGHFLNPGHETTARTQASPARRRTLQLHGRPCRTQAGIGFKKPRQTGSPSSSWRLADLSSRRFLRGTPDLEKRTHPIA